MKTTKIELELENVITECLYLIHDRGETAKSVAARYPDLEEMLLPPLEAARWLCDRSSLFDPRPGFVQSSKRQLVEKIGQKKPLAA